MIGIFLVYVVFSVKKDSKWVENKKLHSIQWLNFKEWINSIQVLLNDSTTERVGENQINDNWFMRGFLLGRGHDCRGQIEKIEEKKGKY